MKDKIETSILLTTIIFPISMFIINKILGIFDWHLRSWIWWLVFFIIHIGGYIFTIFAISTMKSKVGKIIVMLIWSIICIPIFFINLGFSSWIIKLDSVKEIDGTSYVGVQHLTNRLRSNVYYYNDYNIFAYKDEIMSVEEFYNEYEILEFRIYYDKDRKSHTIYFDENGNVITREEALKLNY